VDRTVKDLQSQIERKEKANTQLQEDVSRSRDKIEKLLKTIDELQSSESNVQLIARRAERELREEREKALRLERELEGLKSLGAYSGGTIRRSIGSGSWGRIGAEREALENGVEVPERKSSLSRKMSMSKGFL
jgi:myosin protein heavy chain